MTQMSSQLNMVSVNKKWTLFICMPLLLLLSFMPAKTIAKGIDTELQKCIEDHVQKTFDSITEQDFKDITYLGCNKRGIVNIAGIEKLSNLKAAYFNNNQISSISPLGELFDLEELYLANNLIGNIEPLAHLVNLKFIHIENNQIEDIGPLAQLIELDELILDNNPIGNLAPLQNLTKLNWLELPYIRTGDVSSLAQLRHLAFLNLAGNGITDIDALKNLKSLNRLNLDENQISDITALKDLPSLTKLNLSNNNITDLSPLAGLNDLQYLYLDSNKIRNVNPLKKLSGIVYLDLDNNLIDDLTPLKDLPKINHLSVLNNCIKDFGAVDQAGNVEGVEFQHHLCNSHRLVRKKITKKWLDTQTIKQCVDFGDNDYTLKSDYVYFPDGIYYFRFIKGGGGFSCRLPWNSNIEDFIGNLEKLESITGKYEIFTYKGNHIYVKNGLVKGFSTKNRVKARDEYDHLNDILEMFQVSYEFEKQQVGKDITLTAMGNGYFIQVIDDSEKYTVQFFEKDFFKKEIRNR